MSVPLPVVRYLIVCEDVITDARYPRQVTLVNLISAIRSRADPPFPIRHPELCVFVQITEARGQGDCRIQIEQLDPELTIFRARDRTIQLGSDPLEVHGLTFRVRNCTFPAPGLYMVQFWFSDTMIAQQPLLLR